MNSRSQSSCKHDQAYFTIQQLKGALQQLSSTDMDVRIICLVVFFACDVLTTLTSNVVRGSDQNGHSAFPAVVNTWGQGGFLQATVKAWDVLTSKNGSALDAIEQGLTACEELQCDGTVGYGGSPDENGETTLDAMIMDGGTMNVGAVSALRRVKNAISVARRVLHNTAHSMLTGNQATEFAVQMGFKETTLSTKSSKMIWLNWKQKKCQPNFWRNVSPDPRQDCGPYVPCDTCNEDSRRNDNEISSKNHDTISMIAIDATGKMAAGTSTNGARHKIPGRVGDSPIPGSGAYVDEDVGGAGCTGDGDVMLRFLPSFVAVEEMRRGSSPEIAGRTAIQRIVSKYPHFQGAVVALRKDGVFGAACHGLPDKRFPFSVANPSTGKAQIFYASCT